MYHPYLKASLNTAYKRHHTFLEMSYHLAYYSGCYSNSLV